MTALIKKAYGGTYCAAVLALRTKKWDREIVSFSEDFSQVLRIPIWKPKRQVYLLSEDSMLSFGQWSANKDLMGEILNNKMLRSFKKGVPVSSLSKDVKRFATPLPKIEWHTLQTFWDIHVLMGLGANFYKSKIISCSCKSIVLDTRGECVITLKILGGELPFSCLKKGTCVNYFYIAKSENKSGFLFRINDTTTSCNEIAWKIEV